MTEPGPLVRAVMTPIGEHLGLDPLVELAEESPGRGAPAFHLAACGAHLLLAYREPRDFPAYGGRASKRGAKWVTRSFAESGGQRATVFLAHALGIYLAEELTRRGQTTEVEQHNRCRSLLREQLPLSDEEARSLDGIRREYVVMDTKQVPEDVADGVELGTGYHQALLDPDFAEGRGPDEVPELLDAQRQYASRYLRMTAGVTAIEMAIGSERFHRIEADVIRPGDARPEVLEYDRGDLGWWLDVAGRWREYAALALS